MKPYIGNAIIGNGRMLAALGSNGEMHRLFWPQIDMYQQLNLTWATVLSPVFGDRAIRLDDEGNWVYSQEYVRDTNIMKTSARAKRADLSVEMLDFVLPDRDILVRRFEITNKSGEPIPVVFLYYTSFHINESSLNNAVSFDNDGDILLHYKQGTWLAVGGNKEPGDYQCGWCEENSLSGYLNGNGLSMASDGCQAWNLGSIKPGRSKSVTVYFAAGRSQRDVKNNILYVRGRGTDSILQETAEFWEKYLEQGFSLDCTEEEVKQVYKRSIMVCFLLMNRDTGGVIAAPEFDPTYNRCGGYGYCWPRDGVYIAHAMLKNGYPEYARKFYQWAANCQDHGGGWPQRLYTNGELAAGWGDQIDETGTVLWGMYQLYKETWDIGFAELMWPTLEKAAAFLLRFMDSETGLPAISWDPWEERLGQHAYSCAAVFAGLKGAGLLAKALGEAEAADRWLAAAKALQAKIIDYFWQDSLDRFIRTGWIAVSYEEFERHRKAGESVKEVIGPKGYITYLVFGDDRADASLLGLVFPFSVIAPDNEKMRKTADYTISVLNNSKTGGIMRYSGDHYIGGNPWVLTTLWAGIFEGVAGNWEKAGEYLRWAVEHRTGLGLLPEQIDRETGHTAWVVPLAWSHAMFLLLMNMMSEAKKL